MVFLGYFSLPSTLFPRLSACAYWLTVAQERKELFFSIRTLKTTFQTVMCLNGFLINHFICMY
jgi:hypothetical protein